MAKRFEGFLWWITEFHKQTRLLKAQNLTERQRLEVTIERAIPIFMYGLSNNRWTRKKRASSQNKIAINAKKDLF